jgi:sugar lactone lactonase YvrE
MMNFGQAELVLDVKADLGEGPLWDDRAGQLVWVDIMAGRVNLFDPLTGENRSIDVGVPVGAAALRESGGLVLAVQDGFAALDTETGKLSQLSGFPGAAADIRMNDAKCDSLGRMWAGTMAFDLHDGAGALYRFNPDGGVTTMLTGITCSNGTDWSPDGKLMYYVDSMTRRIDCFDFDAAAGAISGRRTFVEIEPKDGVPDGLTVDSEGNVWAAIWGGRCVRCYSPDARLLGSVAVPSSQSSCCVFGGKDLDELYITSARTGLPEEELAKQPLAGGLFMCRPGVKGVPANRFAG